MSIRQKYIAGINCVHSWIKENRYTQEQCDDLLMVLECLRDGKNPKVFDEKPTNTDLIAGSEEDPLFELVGFYAPSWWDTEGNETTNPNGDSDIHHLLMKMANSTSYYIFGEPE